MFVTVQGKSLFNDLNPSLRSKQLQQAIDYLQENDAKTDAKDNVYPSSG